MESTTTSRRFVCNVASCRVDRTSGGRGTSGAGEVGVGGGEVGWTVRVSRVSRVVEWSVVVKTELSSAILAASSASIIRVNELVRPGPEVEDVERDGARPSPTVDADATLDGEAGPTAPEGRKAGMVGEVVVVLPETLYQEEVKDRVARYAGCEVVGVGLGWVLGPAVPGGKGEGPGRAADVVLARSAAQVDVEAVEVEAEVPVVGEALGGPYRTFGSGFDDGAMRAMADRRPPIRARIPRADLAPFRLKSRSLWGRRRAVGEGEDRGASRRKTKRTVVWMVCWQVVDLTVTHAEHQAGFDAILFDPAPKQARGECAHAGAGTTRPFGAKRV